MSNFSFKRFFTFGLGMGKTASATSGFMGSVTSFVKDRWAETGWRFVAGGVGGGLAVFSLYLAAAIATGNAHAQTVVGTTFGTTNNTSVTSKYTTTITGGTSGLGGTHVLIGGAGKNTVITGNSTNITTTSTTIGVTGGNVKVEGLTTDLNAKKTTINSIDTVVTSKKTTVGGALVVGAGGDDRTGQNGIYQLNTSGTTAARIDRNGTLSIIGTGGTEAAPVFKVDGKSGVLDSKANINTTGTMNAATANFGGAGVGAGMVGVGAGNKIVLNGNNGNATIGGVALLNGGAYVGPRADNPSGPALTVNGLTATKGIHNGDQKITGVANGNVDAASDQAVNGSQLHTTNTTVEANRVTAANATTLVQTNVDNLTTTVTNNATTAATATALVQSNLNSEVARVDGRIDATNTSVTNLSDSVDTRFGALTTASSADVHSNGVTGAEQSITTGTGSVAQQLNSVVSSTATTINSTNVRVTTVEGKTQNITASAGETNVAGNLSVSGSTKTNGIDNSGQKITKVAAGTDNTDAVNVGQLQDVVQSQSGADRGYTNQQVGAERERAMAAEAAISKEVRQVGAMAMAAAAVGAATPVGDKKTAVSVAVGGYSGEAAVAIGVTHMVKPTTRIFGSISSVSRGKTGVAVGASFSF